MVVVVVIVFVALYAIGVILDQSGNGGRQTWQQWGMSIQYPSGVKAQYQGVLDQQADASSRQVEWLWNGADTGLTVVWIATPAFNVTAGLRSIESGLLTSAVNVTQSALGNVTMGSHSWTYLSVSFTTNGLNGFGTFSGTYYQSSGRAYFIGYIDTKSGTLQSLESYGNTFSG